MALLGGHIDITSGNPNEVMELVKANKVRILGALTEKRITFLPDVPTVKEQGVDAVGLGMTRGIVAPGGHPRRCPQDLGRGLLQIGQDRRLQEVSQRQYDRPGMDG